MKKTFKNLLLPATGLVILPIASCNTVKPEEETTTLEIVSKIEDITVTQTSEHLSTPIKTKCIGPDKQERLIDIKFNLNMTGNSELPNWICMTEKNEIQVTGGKDIGTYTFTLSAYNDELKLYSGTKTFKVNVVDERHIVPDKLDIDVADDQYYAYKEQSNIPINITPSKEGIEEKYLFNECKCNVEILSGEKTLDLEGNPLFYCNEDPLSHTLSISKSTNDTYKGDYTLKISAVLDKDQAIVAEKEIVLHIDNVLEQYDSVNKCKLTRYSTSSGWTIESIEGKPNVIRIKDVVVQHKHIVKVGVNFCYRSDITALSQVILPESVNDISDSAFADQGNLCSIEMPGVKRVGSWAFENCSMLELRAGSKAPEFTTVGNFAFSGCKLWKLGYQPALTWIGNNAFVNASFNSFELGKDCGYIGQYAFMGCSNMKTFEIHAVEPPRTGAGLFSECSNLDCIHVPAESLDAYNKSIWWKDQGKRIEGI